MATPFVGRERELAVLRDAYARARETQSAVAVVVHGEPGSGKTRLLAEARSGVPIEHQLTIAGYEPERGVPLAAARGLLQALGEVPEAGASLGTLLHGPAAGPLEPLRVFEAAHRAMIDLGPTLIALDDVQWADDLSLALCHYLVRAAGAMGHPLCVFAAARPSAASRAFAGSLAHLLSDGGFVAVELGPLDRDDGMRLVREIQPALDAEAAAEMWRRAVGIPFWLEVLARSRGDDAEAGDIVAMRVRGAGADAASALATLTLSGRPLLAEEVAEIQEWPPARAEQATDELVRRGLAVEASGLVAIAHDIIREAAARHLPAVQRPRLHRRIAAWLEHQAGEDLQLLLEAVEHRLAGGLPVLHLALRVARSPRRRLLGPDGLHRLAAIADEGDAGDAHVLALQGEVASLAGDIGEHSLALERWGRLADHLGDAGARARASLAAAEAAMWLERAPEARAFVEHGRAEAVSDPVLAVELDAVDADVTRWLENRMADARSLSEGALAAARRMAEEAGGPERMVPEARHAYLRALRSASDAARIADDAADGLRIAEETVAVARDFSDVAYVRAMTAVGFAFLLQRRFGEAEARERLAWQEAHRRVLPALAIEAGEWLIRALHSRGHVAEAEEIARECLELGARIGEQSRTLHEIATFAHVVAISAGEGQEATCALRERGDAEREPHYRSNIHFFLATALSRLEGAGAAAEVAERLAASEEDLKEVDCRRCKNDLALRGIEALARVGLVDDARRWAARWDASGSAGPPPWRRLRGQASIEAAAGERERAVASLRALLDEAARLDMQLEWVWAGLDLAAQIGDSDRDGAVDLLRECAERSDRLGASVERGFAERALRAYGVRTWRRGRSGEGLSDREREIAELVSSGATNPEIARTLFLSRKTVERHVSNILAKLRVRNRAELAGRLRESPATGDLPPKGEGVPR